MSPFQRLSEVARQRLKRYAGARPWLYFPLTRRWGKSGHLLVTSRSDICIEGWPRSANSFAVSAFQRAQPGPVSVAHHTHAAANLMQACELGVPAVLLVRPPRAAVTSRHALMLEVSAEAGEEHPSAPVPLVEHLRGWRAFYRATRPYASRYVIAPFPQVTNNFGAIIRQVNEQFGKDFGVFEHAVANVEAIRQTKGYHALPNQRREALKKRVRKSFERALEKPHVRRLLAKTNEIYNWYEQEAYEAV